MKLRNWIRPRMLVLLLLWLVPVLIYIVIGAVAIYQNDWLWRVAASLPVVWFVAWLVGKLWKPAKLNAGDHGNLLQASQFWTARDTEAIAVVERYCVEANDIDRNSIADPARYHNDAQALANQLAEHYYGRKREHPFENLTLIEVFTVIHLAVEDLEEWTLRNIPGSDLFTIERLSQLPAFVNALDGVQKFIYFASSVFNPSKLLGYPLWRKSGRVTIELQNEVVRRFYQQYLRLVGFYLIEMYSGRLRGGSKKYRAHFGNMSVAAHDAKGQLEQLEAIQDVPIKIAVMGQVKAGKSSLINALLHDQVASTGILPETREVHRFEFPIAGSPNVVTLLDSPGYDEADVPKHQLKEITLASESADIILLVMAANVSARQADLAIVKQLDQHYQERPQLKRPIILGVLTHIDLLRPVREWSPPYDWRNPNSLKEQSIAGAVQYARDIFGNRVAGYACVYTGQIHATDTSFMDELVSQIMEHLDQGKSAAILKAFYGQLGKQRFQRLAKQALGLFKSVVS